MFGSTNNASGLQNQQEQPKPVGSLFGGSLFGQQNQQQQPPSGATGGLFSNLGQSQPASGSLFGSQMQQPAQQQPVNGSIFGGFGQSTSQQPQPTLTASIDQNPYGQNALFNYNGQKLDYGSSHKKPALPPLVASSFRLTPSSKSQINRLRGFASPLNSSQSPLRSSSPLNGLGSPGKSTFANSPASTDRYRGLTDTALTPNAFVPRPSIKKLTVTPKPTNVNSEDRLASVLGKSALKSSANGSQSTPDRGTASPGTSLFNPPNGNREVAESSSRRATPVDGPSRIAGSERQPKKGEYWCRPKLDKLKQMGRNDLRELHNFTAGRRGYGEVTFQDPVDLTGLDLQDLLGTVIVFSDMELAVYPDDYHNKPERGQDLNVPAQITLENCFSKDKATKQPITDQSDPRHARFLKRVKTIPDTDFVSYTDDGCWTFRVEHFSRYGIADSDEYSDASNEDDKVEEEVESRSSSGAFIGSDSDSVVPPTKGLRDEDEDESENEEHDSGLDEDEEYEAEGSEHSDHDMISLDPDDLDPKSRSPEWDQPLKAKIGLEGMRKLREMQSSFFGERRSAKVDSLPQKRNLDAGAFFGEAGEDDIKLDERAVKVGPFIGDCS